MDGVYKDLYLKKEQIGLMKRRQRSVVWGIDTEFKRRYLQMEEKLKG